MPIVPPYRAWCSIWMWFSSPSLSHLMSPYKDQSRHKWSTSTKQYSQTLSSDSFNIQTFIYLIKYSLIYFSFKKVRFLVRSKSAPVCFVTSFNMLITRWFDWWHWARWLHHVNWRSSGVFGVFININNEERKRCYGPLIRAH